MKPAKQARSEETLRQLVRAAERVLRKKSYESAGVAEIAEQAGVTVGAVYFRFANKDALFDYLEDSAFSQVGDRLEQSLQPLSKGDDVESRLARALSTLAAAYVEHRGVARSIIQRARSNKKRESARAKKNRALFDAFGSWLEEHYPPARKAGRERVNTAMLFATTTLRERIIFRDFWAGDGLPDTEELCLELAAAITSYLKTAAKR